MLEENWTNPNEPREGSRRSTRKRVPVLCKEPNVIQHRLLLGPTLARRKARKRRREQEKNATTRSGKDSKKEKSSGCVNRKDEISRKLGPLNLTVSITASPDNVLSKQPPSSTAACAPATSTTSQNARSIVNTSSSRKRRMDAPPRQSQSKERKKKSSDNIEQRKSEPVNTVAQHNWAPTSSLTPDLTTAESDTTSTVPQSTVVPVSRNPPAAALVSPLGLTSSCDHQDIQSIMLFRRRQMLEDSKTLQLLRIREHAILLMQRSTDVSSIIASTRLVREYYANTIMDPTTRVLLEDSEGRGMLWLSKLLIRSFSKSLLLGGLGFSLAKATLISDEIVVNLADVIGKVELTYATLGGLRILPYDTLTIAPILRVIGTAIKEKFLAFRQEIILKAQTCYGLPMIPTAASFSSPLPLGVATAYGF